MRRKSKIRKSLKMASTPAAGAGTVSPLSTMLPGNFNINEMTTLSYLNLTTGFLSLIGSATIVIAAIVKGKVSNQEVHPIFHLSLADFFGSAFLVAGAITYHALGHGAIKSQACPYLTGAATAFYMCTFLLTLNYARSVNDRVEKRVARNSIARSQTHLTRMGVHHCSTMLVWYGFAWFLPFMVTLLLFAIDQTSYGPNDNICSSCLPLFHYKNSKCQKVYDPEYLSEPDWYSIYKYIFLLLLAVSLIGAVAFNMMAYRTFKVLQIGRGVISQRQREILKSVKRRLGLFSLTFLFCWTPSLILGVISLFPSFQMDNLYWLFIIQACSCPLQGFINCLIYGWQRPGFTQAINERSRLLPRPQTPIESDV